MTIPLSPEVEKALADLRVAVENQLNNQSASDGGFGESTPAMFKTNDETAFASQEVAQNQVEAEVVLPLLDQTSMGGDAVASELPYPDVPDLSSPTSTESVLPQPKFLPQTPSAPLEAPSPGNDNPFLVPEYQESPTGNNLPVDAPAPEEVVANPSFNISAPPVEVATTTAPPPSQGSFAKARGLLSNVLQRGN